ncbi:cap-specific mRNA (nucleoside-2'-O-)-methyltransferase 1-like isoform X2 [Ostrea edulis]|uniref:cap-specific mRNA (nucleoside-2'-O-)-methyltransferase 1-like isoform X2 n=1 Tax=Ostrea edulis TaxID=37623 RepID=UPI0024AE9D07|nr:cap-specific mRNA (nucleoside-2'-O-)-methyltransferase 1-like isoform X2 [Ostrea edulis]
MSIKNFETEQIIEKEDVSWIPTCSEPVPSIEIMRGWKQIGQKKLSIDDEAEFCDENVLSAILNSKSVFDELEPEEMRRARTKSNPYETIRGAFFLNRAAVKLANMDFMLDFMFTSPKDAQGKPMLRPSDILYFADICAGPGGFSEYVLWRTKGDAKGFGMTLKGPCDFKLEDFFAGPPEMFEPHYGVGGIEGDGDIFNPDNQAEFIKFVKDNTEGKGVYFVMADGGFSVEGQENIQEILSKQLYLCQFLVAISILRPGGHFVCKLFDLFTPFSVGLVYLMYRIFHKVSICKPVTSRPANSERYIVCQGLREDFDPVRHYMHEINLDLNRLMVSTSTQDVCEIVPMDNLESDQCFFNYIYESNVNLGKMQISGLKKIQSFVQNTQLYETRQADVRRDCLKRWNLPDEVRKAPTKSNPKVKFEALTGGSDVDFVYHDIEDLSPDTLSNIKTPYNYRCYVIGNQERKRWYLLGLGRSHVFKWDGNPRSRWRKLEEDNIRIELPTDTLIEVEIVQEMKGEGTGQRRMMTLHALDAMFLYGKDIRNYPFRDRIEKLRKFVHSITKLTRPDLTQIIIPYMYRLEEVHQVFDRLEFRRVKGSSNPRLCYSPPDRVDGRAFLPSGLCIVKIVKDPWTMALSKSANQKYFYNTHTKESTFNCPPTSVAHCSDCKKSSYIWKFEEGVKIHSDQTFSANPKKISRDNFLDYIHMLTPR